MPRVMATTRTCLLPGCGTVFSRKPSDPGGYCSRPCAGKAKYLEFANPRLASQIKEDYLTGKSIQALARDSGFVWETVKKMLVRQGVDIRHSPTFLTEAEQAEVIRLYVEEVKGVPEIAFILDCTYDVIYNLLKRQGIPRRHDFENGGRRRPLPLNEDAFAELSPESSYWIGFLMADGWVTSSDNGRYLHVGCALARKDRDHLLKLNEFLGGGDRKITDFSKDGKPYSQVTYRSRKLAKGLMGRGVVLRKSLTAEALDGVDHSPHFWRGMIDGDGHIGHNSVSLTTGSPSMRDQYQAFLVSLGCSPHSSKRKDAETGNTYHTVYCGVDDAFTLLSLLYPPGCSSYLERKQESAQMFLRARAPS